MANMWRWSSQNEYCEDRKVMDMAHIQLYPGAQDCKGKHSRYIWPSLEREESIILADSLLKRFRHLRRTCVHSIPGAKIERFKDEINRFNIDVSYQKVILLHLGTNNLSKDPPSLITSKMFELIDAIRSKNPSCKVLVSGIIMRPQDELDDAKYTRKGNISLIIKRRVSNALIEGMLAARGEIPLLWSWIPLMKGSVANEGMYSEDGLHLNRAGINRFRAYLVKNLNGALSKLSKKTKT